MLAIVLSDLAKVVFPLKFQNIMDEFSSETVWLMVPGFANKGTFILQIFAGNQFYIAREYIFVDFVFNGLG